MTINDTIKLDKYDRSRLLDKIEAGIRNGLPLSQSDIEYEIKVTLLAKKDLDRAIENIKEDND